MSCLKDEKEKFEPSGRRQNSMWPQERRTPSRKLCTFMDVGQVPYEDGLVLQRRARELVNTEQRDGILLLLEHNPVITLGRNGDQEHLMVAEQELKSRGIDLVQTERGGNITCHNPGQLVAYPILNLRKWRQDVHWYVRALEETIIDTLNHFQIHAVQKTGYTGVWTENKKIAAIGILVRRWITSHGLALNVNNDLGLYSLMNPCGISCYGVTSIEVLRGAVEINEVKNVFLKEFSHKFECDWGENDQSSHLADELK